jgi:transcriptional regulator with GAF, ATPase, and Fis domain
MSPAGDEHIKMERTVTNRDMRPEQKTRGMEKGGKAHNRAEDTLKKRLQFEELLSSLSSIFINLPAHKIDREIKCRLKLIVEFLDFDRSTLCRYSEDKKQLWTTHAYSAPGVPPSNVELISDQYPWYTRRMARGEMLIQELLPEDIPGSATIDIASHQKDGLKFHIGVPLKVGGEVLGVLGFGSFRQKRQWDSDLIQRLQLVGEIFANALDRKKSEESLNNALLEIKKLRNQLKADNTYLQEEIKLAHNFENIIGQSQAIKSSLFKVEQVAKTDATVLILGETGTGKELFARAIHNASTRKDRPMVKVNCAALPINLIESELFGHEKGAFTGADSKQIGRFELAKNATLFLDEIGELPFEVQAKLLRVLQNREFERLGSHKTIYTNARVIASTNRDLEKETKNGHFRSDLWYRLNVFPISIPPLRDRKGDIPLLVKYFVQKCMKKIGKRIESIPEHTMQAMQKYAWPGNIRELENLTERAIITTQNKVLQIELPTVPHVMLEGTKTLDEVDRDYIIQVLELSNWKIAGPGGAALMLGLKPNTLRARMEKLGIKKVITAAKR